MGNSIAPCINDEDHPNIPKQNEQKEGSSASFSITESSKAQEPNTNSQGKLTTNLNQVSREKYESYKVYYDGKILEVDGKLDSDKQILYLAVCKTELAGHWYARAHLGVGQGDYRDFHYYNCSSVFVVSKKTKTAVLAQTNYALKERKMLSDLISKCHEIVEKKRPYGKYSYNCQDFVTEIMHEFTDRKVSFIKLPLIGVSSYGYNTKDIFALIEKDFFIKCQETGLDAGLKYLEDLNDSIEKETNNRDDLSETMREFMRKVLTSSDDTLFIQQFCDFLHENRERLDEINEHMLRTWTLANFLMLLDNQSSLGLINPSDALKRCYVYQDYSSMEKVLGKSVIPKLIFTHLEMKRKPSPK